MADLSKLSDAELLKLAGGSAPKADKSLIGKADLSQLSDEHLMKLAQDPHDKGLLQTIGETYDKYAAAPVRSAVSELLRTDKEFGKREPGIVNNVISAGEAFANQFGEDPNLAPTGKDIAVKRLGMSDKPFLAGTPSYGAAKLGISPESGITPEQFKKVDGLSPADIAGTAIDIGADLGNIVPVGTIARGVGKAAGEGARLAIKGSAAALEAIPGGRGITSVAKGTAKLIDNFVKPGISKDFEGLKAIAEANGIDVSKAPEALEFGKDSTISSLGRVQAQGPLGQARTDAAKEFYGQVTDALDNKISQISKGAPLTPAEAGVHIKDSFSESLSNLFKDNEVRYSTIAKQYPGVPLDKAKFGEFNKYLGEIETEAQKSINRNFTPQQTQQAQMILNKIGAIRKESSTLDGATEILQNIGDVAFPKGQQSLVVGPDLKKTRDLYFKLRDTIVDSIETSLPNGVDVASKLRESNKNIAQFMKTIEPIENVIGNPRLAPEQVFNQITRTSSQIDALKGVLSPDDFARIKGSYLDSYLKRNELGFISFPEIRKNFENRQRRAVFERLFDPNETKDILDIAKVGEAAGDFRLRPDTSMGMNFQDIKAGVANAFVGEPTLESLKSRARANALRLPVEAQQVAAPPMFGPRAIGPVEAMGLRLPQQITIQRRNQEKGK